LKAWKDLKQIFLKKSKKEGCRPRNSPFFLFFSYTEDSSKKRRNERRGPYHDYLHTRLHSAANAA
jgi:hypothetical protein